MIDGTNKNKNSILVVDDDESILEFVELSLENEGFEVTTACNGKEALLRLKEAIPDLIVTDLIMPEMDGLTFLRAVRADDKIKSIPVIMLTTRSSTMDIVTGLNLGADDYLPKPFKVEELIARVHSKIERPPVPSENLGLDRQTGLLNEHNFSTEAAREIQRSIRGGKPGSLALLMVNEILRLRDRLGSRAEREIAKQIAELIQSDAHPLDLIGHDTEGRFMILLPEISPEGALAYLRQINNKIVGHQFVAHGENLRLTPTIGFVMMQNEKSLQGLREKALAALDFATSQLDLEPKIYDEKVRLYAEKKRAEQKKEKGKSRIADFFLKSRTFFQVLISFVLSIVVPFYIYFILDWLGMDITQSMYFVVVIALLITAFMIWIEGFISLRKVTPPQNKNISYPTASAIIAAYLPNEALTIAETVQNFLELEYPGTLQIILAYNTPHSMPIENVLRSIAEFDPRLTLLRVEGSESKSQNVNAAISEVKGEFVGIFDADHHPQPDAFMRAWQWLSSGYDVVQGHCLVRNGESSWVARMVAVEFEAIYAVSHPGRARLYDFGIFGGSNGYWKTDLLRKIMMHGFMLTEDIDSSMRVTESGYKIAMDPGIISRELAPGTLKALWNQRMRWAQGWFQVSMEHLLHTIRSKELTLRQKLGAFYLLGWREIYPWLSVQMFPIVAYWIWKFSGVEQLNWLIPIFIITTLFTLSVGPGQVIFAYINSDHDIKQHKSWYVFYLIIASLFYTEFKNIIARVAQIKEFMGERSWRITPRTED